MEQGAWSVEESGKLSFNREWTRITRIYTKQKAPGIFNHQVTKSTKGGRGAGGWEET